MSRRKITKQCIVCGGTFTTSRIDRMYDSEACRAKAYRLRSQSKKNVESKRLDAASVKDVNSVRRKSPMAADFLLKLSYLYSPELAQEALDAVFDLATAIGGADVFDVDEHKTA